jgi:uncharacterized NAD(P)/FAD-binding protein YdhS
MKAAVHCGHLDLMRGNVTDITAQSGGLALTLADGTPFAVDRAVLAIGNFPPSPPPVGDPGFYDTAAYRPDPWAPDLLEGLDPMAPVLMIGTGCHGGACSLINTSRVHQRRVCRKTNNCRRA